VTSKLVDGNKLTLETTQGTMEDVFQEGSFDFKIDMNDMQKEGRLATFNYSVANRIIYQQGPLKIDLESANLNLNPDWFFDFKFKDGKIEYFEMSTANSSFSADAKVKLTASQATSLVEGTDTLVTYAKSYVKRIIVPVFGIPVPVPVILRLKIYWLAEYSASINANVTSSAIVTSNGVFGLGVKYQNNAWQGFYNFNPVNTLDIKQPNGRVGYILKYGWRPLVTAKLYGVAGPRASVGVVTSVAGKVASPSLDWDLKADAWIQAKAGAEAKIFGKSLTDFPDKVWDSPKLTYRKPDKIQRTSGDNQTGQGLTTLPSPIKVRILDSKGGPVSDVPVYIKVKTGGGSVNPASILTDQNGYAETSWKLGPKQVAIQFMEASAKYGDLANINTSPVEFAATAGESTCPATVTDIDGNVYNTVKIGEQCWMKENLKTFRYNDGSFIPSGLSDTAWENATYGAYSTYSNNLRDVTYGKLYNGFAVTDSRKLCPAGWHVPSDSEWSTLENFLGGAAVAGDKMKSTTGWNPPNTQATNESGFSALPGGFRAWYGLCCFSVGIDGHFWWFSPDGVSPAIGYRNLENKSAKSSRSNGDKESGYSVRCIRD
jgi:uncharacterized protein (TIGR02145 family)